MYNNQSQTCTFFLTKNLFDPWYIFSVLSKIRTLIGIFNKTTLRPTESVTLLEIRVEFLI